MPNLALYKYIYINVPSNLFWNPFKLSKYTYPLRDFGPETAAICVCDVNQ